MASLGTKGCHPRQTPKDDPVEDPDRCPDGPSHRRRPDLVDLAETYLRLCPDDAEVRRVRDRLESGTEDAGDLRGCT